MLKFEERDCIWSRTENVIYYKYYIYDMEAFNFCCTYNNIWSSHKNSVYDKRCAIFYKL